MVNQLSKGATLHLQSAHDLVAKVQEMFKPLPCVMKFDTSKEQPLTVVGDVRGHLTEVLKIFEMNGYPSSTNRYLFNGNILVHRWRGVGHDLSGGDWKECQVLFILLAFKILYPDSVHIHGGNHESGYESFVQDDEDQFLPMFRELPMASVINSSVFVVPGGIARNHKALPDLDKLQKGTALVPLAADGSEVPEGIALREMWDTLSNGEIVKQNGFFEDAFGRDDTNKFLAKNNLDLIIRSSQSVEGVEVNHNGKCVTLFSLQEAARYYGTKKSRCAFARFEDSKTPTYVYCDNGISPTQ
jgi:serine/threonine-protein phosphatase 5